VTERRTDGIAIVRAIVNECGREMKNFGDFQPYQT